MKISQAGVDLIKSFEGYETELPDGRCKAYWDADGKVWTIGWGCTEGVKKGDVWTRQQASDNFAAELVEHFAFVQQQAPWANQNEFDALASFSYNGGPGMLRQLLTRYPNKQKLAAAFMLFDHSGGRRLKGLTRRREAEMELFLKPVPSFVGKVVVKAQETHAAAKQNAPTVHFWDGFLDYIGIGSVGLGTLLNQLGAFIVDKRTVAIVVAGGSVWGGVKLFKYWVGTKPITAADGDNANA